MGALVAWSFAVLLACTGGLALHLGVWLFRLTARFCISSRLHHYVSLYHTSGTCTLQLVNQQGTLDKFLTASFIQAQGEFQRADCHHPHCPHLPRYRCYSSSPCPPRCPHYPRHPHCPHLLRPRLQGILAGLHLLHLPRQKGWNSPLQRHPHLPHRPHLLHLPRFPRRLHLLRFLRFLHAVLQVRRLAKTVYFASDGGGTVGTTNGMNGIGNYSRRKRIIFEKKGWGGGEVF